MPIKIVPTDAGTEVDTFKKLAKKKKKKVVKKAGGGKIGRSLVKAGAAEAKRQRVGGPLTRKKIENMTDMDIRSSRDIPSELKTKILDARKTTRMKVKSLTDPKGAAAMGTTPSQPLPWKYSKSAEDAMAGKTKPKSKRKKLRSLLDKKAGGGKVGMSHQGLYPAEEARADTMSEMERVKHMKKGKQVKGVKFKDLGKKKVRRKLPNKKVKMELPDKKVKFREPLTRGPDRLPLTRGSDRESLEHLMQLLTPEMKQKLGLKKGGQVKKKKKKEQGYKARKDESIAMRVKKKRTKKQLKASRDESYGKFGSKTKKRGKINRSSSKGWDGNREVSRHYDS